ncbi:MAG: cytosine permease [Gluconacetobacter diazotrophicus]|nr:cytosine permease [Gluconacetobacter diazotrophicus]
MERTGSDAVTEPVPMALRTMPIDRVFWSHFSPNLGPGGWVTGALIVHMGMGLRSGLLAIAIGNLLGAVPVALAAAMGPCTGLPQIEASRRVLGRLGLRPPAFLNWINCVGWDAVNNVPAAAALIAVLAAGGAALPFPVALGILVAIQGLASVWGHDLVQALQKYIGMVLVPTLAVVGLLALFRVGHAPAVAAHPPTLAAFALATAVILSFNLSWAPYSSDYTRYLPPDAPPRRVVLLALGGLLGSTIPFQLLGLLTAASLPDTAPLAVLGALRNAAGPLGLLALAAIALSSITGNAVNDNTAGYSLISAGIRVGRIPAAIATAAIGYVLAAFGAGRYAELYSAWLVAALYWIAPWIGIVLADWYFRRARPAAAPLPAPLPAWTAEATAFVVIAPLTAILFGASELYTGPVARLLGGADIGYYVGFVSAAGCTLVLRRRGAA